MPFAEALRTLEQERLGSASAVDLDDVELPDVGRRILAHALTEGQTTARGARLRMRGSIVQADRRASLEAVEVLIPLRGFAWRARARMGPAVVIVRDHYLDADSSVSVRLFGLLPMGGEDGKDTVASSRGRLAAESIWVPSMLVPRPGVRWTSVDDEQAEVHMTIDGVEQAVTLRADEQGRLLEVRMLRWGDVGVATHQPIPYGFRVLAERRFDGYTIPSELEGGWWFGTDRFDPERASRFVIDEARFA